MQYKVILDRVITIPTYHSGSKRPGTTFTEATAYANTELSSFGPQQTNFSEI